MAIYLTLAAAGLGWGLWTGFGTLLLGLPAPTDAPGGQVRLLSRPGLAVLATAIGGSGALLTLEGRLSAGAAALTALGSGALVALLVLGVARALGPGERR